MYEGQDLYNEFGEMEQLETTDALCFITVFIMVMTVAVLSVFGIVYLIGSYNV